MLYNYWDEKGGSACIDMPPGAGKSILTAAIARDGIRRFGMKKVLMLTHRKELIEQNSEKMRLLWPNAPLGIYSASIGRKEAHEPIVFAGIQSIQKKSHLLGKVDMAIVDEAHMISHKESGGYRQILGELKDANKDFRLVGLTATPYRLGHGLITDDPALFDGIITPTSILELIEQGFLARLSSKPTLEKIDTENVKKRGGEYVNASLQEEVNRADRTEHIVEEVITRAGDRHKWLFFCSGVKHAEGMAAELRRQGVVAECITEATPKRQRENVLAMFKTGKIKAVTGADILTTGFDCPDIDLIVLARPTMSPGLYVQMVGRGTRLKAHTDHCLILDFAGVVAEHGPITNIRIPQKAGKGDGEAPIKICGKCQEICYASVRLCPECGFEFPPPKSKELFLHGDCVLGIENPRVFVEKWTFQSHITRTGTECLLVKYHLKGRKTPMPEYLLLYHPGGLGKRDNGVLKYMASKTIGIPILKACKTITEVAKAMNRAKCPDLVEYEKRGAYFNITMRTWHDTSHGI